MKAGWGNMHTFHQHTTLNSRKRSKSSDIHTIMIVNSLQQQKRVSIMIRFYIFCTCVCPHVIKLLVSQTVCPRNPRFCMLSCRVLETVDNNNMAKLLALTYIFFFLNVLAKLNVWHIGRPHLAHNQQNHLHFGSLGPVLKRECLETWPFCLIK